MTLSHYPLETNPEYLDYEFLSIGPKGEIRKLVRFTRMEVADTSLDIYNLAFGDYDKVGNTIDDDIITDNKDPNQVLLTVAAAVLAFTERQPNVLIFVQGNTPVRMRYYTMGIATHLDSTLKGFDIWGNIDEEWELFRPNRRYIGLLARRKATLPGV